MSHKKDYEKTDFMDDARKQVRLLINNCKLYDQGEFEHALAIATNLRTILHSSKQKSTSVIRHTNIEREYRFHTSHKTPYNTVMCLLLCTTAQIKFDSEDNKQFVFLPTLSEGDKESSGQVKFNKWWNQKIIIDGSNRYSRRDIVLLSANEHGGTHVDRHINKSFNDLINDIESPMSYVRSQQPGMAFFNAPIKNCVYAVIRQIAHEVLITFKQIPTLEFEYNPEFTNFKVLKDFQIANIALNKGELKYPED